jgi:hypothetical protein
VPYIFAEDSVAVATGRELYGYPKEHAVISMPRAETPQADYLVKALAVPRYSETARAVPDSTILRVRRTDSSTLAGLGHAALEIGEDMLDALLHGRIEGSSIALLKDYVSMFVHKRLDMVFLRQLRAAGAASGCDYQSVVSGPQYPVQLKSLRLLKGRHALELPLLDSHPIAADLGLEVVDGCVDVTIAAKIGCAFTQAPGHILWPPQVIH